MPNKNQVNLNQHKDDAVIKVSNIGISFKKNKNQKKNFKDLFAHKNRRAKAEKFWALKNINFSVMPGEAIGIIGRNGNGKSTLLKIVAGVLLADEGKVELKSGVAPLIEITGGFVGDLSVSENIKLTAALHGLSKKEINEKFNEIIAFSELQDFINTPFKHLSSGMKVRLAFSVISQLDEEILLVDEVLAVGDKAFRQKCHNKIHELLANGKTLFLVSHNEKDLINFCSRGIYLKNGKIVMDSDIKSVITKYNFDNNN